MRASDLRLVCAHEPAVAHDVLAADDELVDAMRAERMSAALDPRHQ